jgi:hypothetical protein
LKDLLPRLATIGSQKAALFLAGVGILALHLVDDSFVHPEAGTAARDHLVSGLVPLPLLVLAGAVYPRLRAGARAALAVFLGSFAIVVGTVEAVYDLVTGSFSGGDYTGLLTLPGGLLLVALGAVHLWKTRRHDESRHHRYARRLLLGLAAAAVGFEFAFPILAAYG